MARIATSYPGKAISPRFCSPEKWQKLKERTLQNARESDSWISRKVLLPRNKSIYSKNSNNTAHFFVHDYHKLQHVSFNDPSNDPFFYFLKKSWVGSNTVMHLSFKFIIIREAFHILRIVQISRHQITMHYKKTQENLDYAKDEECGKTFFLMTINLKLRCITKQFIN